MRNDLLWLRRVGCKTGIEMDVHAVGAKGPVTAEGCLVRTMSAAQHNTLCVLSLFGVHAEIEVNLPRRFNIRHDGEHSTARILEGESQESAPPTTYSALQGGPNPKERKRESKENGNREVGQGGHEALPKIDKVKS